MDDLLNVELVRRELIEAKGMKVRWLYEQLGLSRSTGYQMFRNGLLPKEPTVRRKVLEQLAKFMGKEVPQILLSPSRPRRSA